MIIDVETYLPIALVRLMLNNQEKKKSSHGISFNSNLDKEIKNAKMNKRIIGHRTFLLYWNSLRSNYKVRDFETGMKNIADNDFYCCWPLSSWIYPQNGDLFYMVHSDGTQSSIVMRGYFATEPYEYKTPNDEKRRVIDIKPTCMIDPCLAQNIMSIHSFSKGIENKDSMNIEHDLFLSDNQSVYIKETWELILKKINY